MNISRSLSFAIRVPLMANEGREREESIRMIKKEDSAIHQREGADDYVEYLCFLLTLNK